MKRLNELSFEEVKQMYDHALNLSVGFQEDATKETNSGDDPEKGVKLQRLHQQWTEYARLLFDELQHRIKYALNQETIQTD